MSDIMKPASPGVAVATVGLLCLLLTACAGMLSGRLGDSIASGIQSQDEPQTVAAAMPAYLVMIDGLIEESPREARLLLAGARLYSAYAALFVEDEQRARRLAAKGFAYARRAICLRFSGLCAGAAQRYPHFAAIIRSIDRQDALPLLYGYATAWAARIQVSGGQWGALADVPKVELLLKQVITLDDDYDHGQPHVYLGIINSRLPAALGGHPEVGRAHFERAIAVSHGRNLAARLAYARYYARLLFDRPLHDKLLRAVLAADPHESGLTLSNVMAQQQARNLLEHSAEYFEE